jgi:hypothetical protein
MRKSYTKLTLPFFALHMRLTKKIIHIKKFIFNYFLLKTYTQILTNSFSIRYVVLLKVILTH